MPSPIKRIADLIRKTDGFLVAAHVNPDGDAIGSTVAMGHILHSLGKTFCLFNASGLPHQFDWLPLPGPVHTGLCGTEANWIIVLDCGAASRVGPELHQIMSSRPVANIDHHLGNPCFGQHNWVDDSYPAVAAMIADLADELGVPLTGPLGEAIYLGIATDTGFFTFDNTDPRIMELGARLIRLGLEPGKINAKIRNQWSIRRFRLWGESFATTELHYGGQVALAVVTRAMMARTETNTEDTEEIVNFLRRLRGTRAAALLREEPNGAYKFSLRSTGADNVQQVAARFDGGGHRNAAGGTIESDLETAKNRLVKALGEGLGLV
ncbi:phosphoesterase RecJ domain-containing protein [Humidesulfovibrio mexicanus]|uniref:Phosphoesterase RecJ domain-containing protein n=1 Tax=Humidesulfovibrio mexicanus TaxID=147047 RepID=A0A238Y1A0_9BACT|nr:bifunctional oligoribonuclease/PAP phosphatase NrnA [Humidesulfovibrio mexicanus]SNR64551.1 phosphoesterase RecJ domain-containing protein [Humidesulfovibrio mexicanus]